MRTLLLTLSLLVAAPALAGCLSAGDAVAPTRDAAPVDAGAPLDLSEAGPLPWERALYDFGPMVVTDRESGAAYPVPVRGSVHYPTGGAGPFPLVLFMHGRHATCEVLGDETAWQPQAACQDAPPYVEPVRSFEGYDYIAEPLASRGYVVVSVDANEINNRDLLGPRVGGRVVEGGVDTGDEGIHARAQLILRTLDEFERLHEAPGEPVGDALVGRLDTGRVGLMGHSRGAEGVTMALELNAARPESARHGIRAVFAMAAMDRNEIYAADAAWLALVPSCDGDVSDLSGAAVYDRSRYVEERAPSPKAQVVALGANHNFYNTVWTGDDAWWPDDPYCRSPRHPDGPGAGRLTADEQQRQGRALVGGFFQLHLGGEEALAPWLRGAAAPPAGACPDAAACPGAMLVSHHPPEGERLLLEDTVDASTLKMNDLGGASRFEGFAAAETCDARECPAQPSAGLAHQLRLAWEGPAAYALEVPAGHADVRGYGALTFRAAVDFTDARNPEGQAQDLRVVLRDGAGREASARAGAHSEALMWPPGTDTQRSVLSMVRVPLAAFEGVDLGDVREARLVFDATPAGAVYVTDVMLQK